MIFRRLFPRRSKPILGDFRETRAKTLVLMYHRVTPDATDPALLKVSVENFREQMEVLKTGFQVVPLQKVGAAESTQPSIIITFDDGYEDNFQHAAPILREYGIPATIFVTSGYVLNPREFWWDGLARIFIETDRLPNSLDLVVGEKRFAFDALSESRIPHGWNVLQADQPNSRVFAYRALAGTLRTLPFEQREATMDTLSRWAGVPSPSDCSQAMSAAMVRELSTEGLVEIGAHTVTHPVLSSLSISDATWELLESKRTLEGIIGGPVSSFAYPFGSKSDYSQDTVNIAVEAGFSQACSNFPGSMSDDASRFEIPRYMVFDWNGADFTKMLNHWCSDSA